MKKYICFFREAFNVLSLTHTYTAFQHLLSRIRVYCKTKQYLKLAIEEGAKRCNIEGEEVEEVITEHFENTKEILEQIYSKLNKKHKIRKNKNENNEMVNS